MVSDIWLRTILIVRKKPRCRHIGYSYRLTARVVLYAPSHRQDNTYHSLCYTSCGALAGTRNSSMGPPWKIDPTTHRTMSECSYHGATPRSRMNGYLFSFLPEVLVLVVRVVGDGSLGAQLHTRQQLHAARE